MNASVFEDLVRVLEGFGAPWSCPQDWILCKDLDILRDIRPGERRKWLKKAKAEALRRALQVRVDELMESAENEDELTVDVLLAAFPEDIKLFKDVSPTARRKWIEKAELAARRIPHKFQEVPNAPSIYFISTGTEFIKIGFTVNLRSRLRSLRTASPKPVHVHLAIPGKREDENELHRLFSEDRVQGEWFRFTDAIKDFIEEASKSSPDGAPA